MQSNALSFDSKNRDERKDFDILPLSEADSIESDSVL